MTPDLSFARVDPTAGRHRLLAVRDPSRKVYRAEMGDAHAIVVPRDGTLRIPYVEAEGETRMHELIDALTDAVGCRSIRFVAARVRDDPFDRAAKRVFGDRYLEDVLHDAERVDEEWSPPDDAVEKAQTVTCLDVEWSK